MKTQPTIYTGTPIERYEEIWQDEASTIPYDLSNVNITVLLKQQGGSITHLRIEDKEITKVDNTFAYIIPCSKNTQAGVFDVIYELRVGDNVCAIKGKNEPLTITSI